MKIIRDWKKAGLKRSSVAIGVFDGAHLGHRAILKKALRLASRMQLSPVVLTMDPHPSLVLHPERRDQLIYDLPHRLRIFEDLGFEAVVVLKFNKALARMSADQFVEEILVRHLGVRAVAVGKNFRFGHKAVGDTKFLHQAGKRLGFSAHSVQPVLLAGSTVSSSRIRAALLAGDFALASRLLGRSYALSGKVVRGDGRGAKIGFPTINLKLEHELLPPPGVYSVRAATDRAHYTGVMHLGPRPTFGSTDVRVEVHLLDAPPETLYGRSFQVTPVQRIRAIRRFADTAALTNQIRRDISAALRTFTTPCGEGILVVSQRNID